MYIFSFEITTLAVYVLKTVLKVSDAEKSKILSAARGKTNIYLSFLVSEETFQIVLCVLFKYWKKCMEKLAIVCNVTPLEIS